jgi:hypothetical protein
VICASGDTVGRKVCDKNASEKIGRARFENAVHRILVTNPAKLFDFPN